MQDKEEGQEEEQQQEEEQKSEKRTIKSRKKILKQIVIASLFSVLILISQFFRIIIVEPVSLDDINSSLFEVIFYSVLNSTFVILAIISLFYVVSIKDFIKLTKRILLKKLIKYVLPIIVCVIILYLVGVNLYNLVGLRITFNILILLVPVYETYSAQGVIFFFMNLYIYVIVGHISLLLSKYQKQIKVE